MIKIPPKILQGTQREYPIEHLFMLPRVKPGGAEERPLLCWLLPPWQRDDVWDDERKRKFIEGIFLGLGTGYYVVHEPDWDANGALPMSGWLIDGQQRLSALRDFVRSNLKIFGGVGWGDLDAAQARRFLRTAFPCVELAYQPDEARLRELYDRLNFGGVPHTQYDRQRLLSKPLELASSHTVAERGMRNEGRG